MNIVSNNYRPADTFITRKKKKLNSSAFFICHFYLNTIGMVEFHFKFGNILTSVLR